MRTCSVNDSYCIDIFGTIQRVDTGQIINPMADNRKGKLPYYRVNMWTDGIRKRYPVHRLVADAFLPAPTEENCEVDHIDNNPQNNHASNLRWVTKSFNLQRRRTETMGRKNSETDTGERHIKHPISRGVVQTHRFKVYINQKDLKHCSCHATLDEAIAERDRMLS